MTTFASPTRGENSASAHSGRITDFMYWHDLKLLLSSSFDHTVKFWAGGGRLVDTIKLNSPIFVIALNQRRQQVVIGFDAAIKLYNLDADKVSLFFMIIFFYFFFIFLVSFFIFCVVSFLFFFFFCFFCSYFFSFCSSFFSCFFFFLCSSFFVIFFVLIFSFVFFFFLVFFFLGSSFFFYFSFFCSFYDVRCSIFKLLNACMLAKCQFHTKR